MKDCVARVILGLFCGGSLLGLVPKAEAQTTAGNALMFHGGAFVSMSNSAALNLYPLTIMGWVDNQSFGGGMPGLVSKFSFDGFRGYRLLIDSGQLRASYSRDFGSFLADVSGGFLPFGWRHVAFTVDDSGGRIYVDGTLRGHQPWIGKPGPANNAEELWLGRSDFDFFFGAMDEMSLWNVALSPEQINSLQHRRLAANEPGLVAYWPFEEGFGNVTADLASTAGGDNMGRLFGPAWIQSGALLSPVVYTFPLQRQTLTGATLSGSVTPSGLPTTAWFEWGTNGSLGNVTPPVSMNDPSNPVPVSFEITGLDQGASYIYRLVATNSNGRANGNTVSFTQPIYPGPGGVPHIRSTHYDGASSSVAFNSRPQWDRAVPMTVEAWVYRKDANRSDAIIGHDAVNSYWLGFGPRLRFSRGGNFTEAPFTVPTRKWSHVAVTYDGAIARFYLNGEYRASRSLTNDGAGKMGTLRLGTPTSELTVKLLGNLDEVRLWSVVRSAQEIRESMYREVREGTGLEAVFPRGGYIEELSAEVGGRTAITEEIFGMLPRDLVVPRAPVPPIADGYLELSGEYLGAEQLVLRYPDDPLTYDTVAHFVHTDNDLFVGLKSPHPNSEAVSWLSLFIDPTYDRPALAEDPQMQIQAFQDLDPNHRALLNGDAGGGYYYCERCNPFFGCHPCTPAHLWEVGKLMCEGEQAPPCTEFRVSRSLLGSWDEYDGVALGHFNFTPLDDQAFVPEEGYPDSPATWLTMSYGQGSANLPRVFWTGKVFAGLTPGNPLVGHRVSLSAGGAIYTNLTDANGQFSFYVPMPTGQVIYAQIDNVAFARYRMPMVETSGYQPVYIFTNDVRYPAIRMNVNSLIQLASVNFFVQEPLPASTILSANPTNPMCGTSVRQGVPGGPGEIVTIFGTNLHADMEFYLSPYTTFNDPPSWTLIRAELLWVAPDGNSVQVRTPYVPEHVRAYANASFIPSFTSKWRWVAYDSWFRFGVDTYSYFGEFSIQRPPYPLTHGFNFENKGGAPDFLEFLGCYGNSAYICVGAFGYCATRIPDPLYWGIWWPVYYLWIKESGGSCVGMAGTSSQLFHGMLLPSNFDPQAIRTFGIDNPGYPGAWDYSNTGTFYTRPPIPLDIWARVRMNHGAQTSREFIYETIDSQLSYSLSTDPINGDPVARLLEIRASLASAVVCMTPSFGDGHAVTPWRVEDNIGGDPNKSRIFVYDSNAPCTNGAAATNPCVTNQWIDIDHSANTYHFRRRDWTGKGIFAVPVSIFNGDRHAPGLETIEKFIVLLVVGSADAHYGSSGGEWGWRQDGTFVNTLPGVRPVTPLGSPDNSTRSVPVFLPHSNAIPSISMNVRDTNAYLFHAAAGGTMLQMEFTGGQVGARDQVQLGAHSNELASFRFTPQNAHSNFIPRIGFTIHSNACATFQWMGLTSESGKAQEFRALKNQRAVEYCNLTTRATQHYLRIDAVDGSHSNNTCAVFGPFNVPTGAVHCVVLSDWPRANRVRSELDLDADGTPDQVSTVSGVSIDSDGDDLPDAWETLHQLNPNAVDCDDGADADPDRDGISNYGEYLSETDPRDPASAMRLAAQYRPNNRVRLTWRAVPGRKYEIHYANTFEYVFRPIPGAGFPRVATSNLETYEEALPAPGTQTRFYRLQLVP